MEKMSTHNFGRRAVLSSLLPYLVMRPMVGAAQETAPQTSGTQQEKSIYNALGTPGEFGLPQKSMVIKDKKDNVFFIWAPPKIKPEQSVGLVVFSAAELELPESYSALLSLWASHGFVVVAPLPDDSVVRDGLLDMVSGQDPDIFWKKTEFGEKRAAAMSAALDIVTTIEATVRAEITDERPVAAGHGIGAYAAQLIAGTRAANGRGGWVAGADPRFYASLLLSPPGRGILGLTKESWQTVKTPLFVSTGNGDSDASRQPPDVKTDSYSLPPPGNRHLAWLGRVNKTLWSGESAGTNPIRAEIFGDILATTTGFIKAYGNYDETMLRFISGGAINRASQGRVAMFYR